MKIIVVASSVFGIITDRGIIAPDFSQGVEENTHSALANSIMAKAELYFTPLPRLKSRGNYSMWVIDKSSVSEGRGGCNTAPTFGYTLVLHFTFYIMRLTSGI